MQGKCVVTDGIRLLQEVRNEMLRKKMHSGSGGWKTLPSAEVVHVAVGGCGIPLFSVQSGVEIRKRQAKLLSEFFQSTHQTNHFNPLPGNIDMLLLFLDQMHLGIESSSSYCKS